MDSNDRLKIINNYFLSFEIKENHNDAYLFGIGNRQPHARIITPYKKTEDEIIDSAFIFLYNLMAAYTGEII